MKINLSRRHALGISAAFLTATALTATPPAFAQTPKDTVVMAKQIDDIISLDPAEAFEFSGVEVGANVYDKLIASISPKAMPWWAIWRRAGPFPMTA